MPSKPKKGFIKLWSVMEGSKSAWIRGQRNQPCMRKCRSNFNQGFRSREKSTQQGNQGLKKPQRRQFVFLRQRLI